MFNWKSLIGGLGRRAVRAAGAILLKVPQLNSAAGYEVRYIEEGWMVFEAGTMLPVQVFKRKADAVKLAKNLARENGSRVQVFKKTAFV